MTWRRALPAVLAAGVFTALTVVMTWPLTLDLASRASTHQDTYFNMWRLRWFAHAIASPARLFDANIFFPETHTFALSDARSLATALRRISPPSAPFRRTTWTRRPTTGCTGVTHRDRVSSVTSFPCMSSFHWFPTVNGYSGVYPPSYLARLERLRAFPEAGALAQLRRDTVRYLILHEYGDRAAIDDLRLKIADAGVCVELGSFPGISGSADRLYRCRQWHPCCSC